MLAGSSREDENGRLNERIYKEERLIVRKTRGPHTSAGAAGADGDPAGSEPPLGRGRRFRILTFVDTVQNLSHFQDCRLLLE